MCQYLVVYSERAVWVTRQRLGWCLPGQGHPGAPRDDHKVAVVLCLSVCLCACACVYVCVCVCSYGRVLMCEQGVTHIVSTHAVLVWMSKQSKLCFSNAWSADIHKKASMRKNCDLPRI